MEGSCRGHGRVLEGVLDGRVLRELGGVLEGSWRGSWRGLGEGLQILCQICFSNEGNCPVGEYFGRAVKTLCECVSVRVCVSVNIRVASSSPMAHS